MASESRSEEQQVQQVQRLSESETKALVKACIEAKARAYNPYSNFRVGAALLTTDGTTFIGCNVENVAYSGTVCAERTAIVKAVSEGHREFRAIAVSSDVDDFISPCGVCRQVMAEFGLDYWIILTKPDGSFREQLVRDLLPHSFSATHLRAGQQRSN